MTDAQTEDVVWTAREAMACAYCWSEFKSPEKGGWGTPEAYWLGITPRARASHRTAADRLLLLAVARGSAVPMAEPEALTMDEFADIGVRLAVERPSRIRKIVQVVRAVYAKRCSVE